MTAGQAIAPSRSTRPQPVRALTGVRFFAALHVVIYHYASSVLATSPWPIKALVAAGPSAVGLFYVLSGAVLVYSCTTNDGELSGSRRSFWQARFARIYPTYLLALFLDAPFFASALLKLHSGIDIVLWGVPLGIAALLLLHAWTPLSVFAWNTPGWSLSAEGFFYALFPSFVGRLRCRSLDDVFRRAWLLYTLALVAPITVYLSSMLLSESTLHTRVPASGGGLDIQTWIVRFAGFSPIARLPEFLLGICLGHWLKLRRGTLSTSRAAPLEVAAIIGLIAACIALGAHPGGKPWLDSGLMAPLFMLLVAALTLGTGPVARLLSTTPLVILGDASYAIYILQEPVLIWSVKVPILGTLPQPIFVPLFIVILIVLSVLCQRYFAEPARLWLLGKPRKVKPAKPSAPAGAVQLP
jgi:peptidoglycan/LPS O-acetylase OafA/YrhL